MIVANITEWTSEYPVACAAIVVGAAVLLYRWFTKGSPLPRSIPIVPVVDGKGTASLMAAREKYPNQPFILPMSEPWVVLPHDMVNEVKLLNNEQVSFMKVSYNRMEGRYTNLGKYEHPEGVAAIRNDLTRNISKVLADLQDEVSFAADKQLGDRPQWKEMWVYGDVLQIVARLSARTFVGMPLCRDEDWIKLTINVTTDVVTGVKKVKSWSPWMRPIVAPFLPEIRKVHKNQHLMDEKIKSQVHSIISAWQQSGYSKKKLATEDYSDEEVTDDNHSLVHWIINNFKDPSRVTEKEIGAIEMGAAFAAIHTTSMALAHIMFDLAARPWIVPELRAEIKAVIDEENDPERRLRKSSIPKLKKLDSFIKESQRLSPPGMLHLTRIVTAKQGLTLSSGHHLPYGTYIAFGHPFDPLSKVLPTTAITEKSQPPLSEFDPWRFYNLRQEEGRENRHTFTSVDDNDITFGGGKHACPGRFFASNEIKVVLMELLNRYEFGLGPEGQGECEEYKRPKLLEFDTFYSPDPYAKIYARNRKV